MDIVKGEGFGRGPVGGPNEDGGFGAALEEKFGGFIVGSSVDAEAVSFFAGSMFKAKDEFAVEGVDVATLVILVHGGEDNGDEAGFFAGEGGGGEVFDVAELAGGGEDAVDGGLG